MSAGITEQARGKVGLAALAAELFIGRVGEVFRLVPAVTVPGTGPDPFELELIEVARRGRAGVAADGTPMREPFSLLFTLRSRTPFGSGLYRLVHESFEPDDLFFSRIVVPGRDPRAVYYEAVFG